MDTQTFLEQMKEILDIEDRELSMEDEFKGFDEWSSLASLSLIAMVDEEYEVTLSGDDIRNAVTVQDLFNLIKSKA